MQPYKTTRLDGNLTWFPNYGSGNKGIFTVSEAAVVPEIDGALVPPRPLWWGWFWTVAMKSALLPNAREKPARSVPRDKTFPYTARNLRLQSPQHSLPDPHEPKPKAKKIPTSKGWYVRYGGGAGTE